MAARGDAEGVRDAAEEHEVLVEHAVDDVAGVRHPRLGGDAHVERRPRGQLAEAVEARPVQREQGAAEHGADGRADRAHVRRREDTEGKGAAAAAAHHPAAASAEVVAGIDAVEGVERHAHEAGAEAADGRRAEEHRARAHRLGDPEAQVGGGGGAAKLEHAAHRRGVAVQPEAAPAHGDPRAAGRRPAERRGRRELEHEEAEPAPRTIGLGA